MTGEYTTDPAHIEARLRDACVAADDAGLTLVRETVEAQDDRWYGQLVAETYHSLADLPAPETVLPAASAIELLRCYWHLRSELFVQLADDRAHSFTRDETAALLAGDYLDAMAHSELSAVDHAALGDCFDVFTGVLLSITEAFVPSSTTPAPTGEDPISRLDATAGSLGEGAALVGATLAGIDDDRRGHVATMGRGLGAARRIRRLLDVDPESNQVDVPALDEQTLREHAAQRRAEAQAALDELSGSVDLTAVRELAIETELKSGST